MELQHAKSIHYDTHTSRAYEREEWKKFRIEIETKKAKSNITGYHHKRSWLLFAALLKVSAFFIGIVGLYFWGRKNAFNVKLNTHNIEIADLPENFEGYTIVHMTDLHFDRVEGLHERIVALLKGMTPDLIVLTGDYKDHLQTPASVYAKYFDYLGKNLKARDGIYATLGNHDSHDLVPIIEKSGIKTLLNESLELNRADEKITLTGLDDVHYYFSPRSIPTLKESPQNACKILLVHSPEIVPEARDNGYSLYLCGHTHAGQVTLPDKKAIFTHVNTGREFAVGRWKSGKLQGYTSSGAGVSGLTVRFNTESEIALIKLKRPQV